MQSNVYYLHLKGVYYPMVEEMTLKDSSRLQVEIKPDEHHIEVIFSLGTAESCQLHWGLSRGPRSAWHLPPREFWPRGSQPYDRSAVRTPFASLNGDQGISIRLDRAMAYSHLVFALFYPETGHWENNHGNNFDLPLPVIKKQSGLPDIMEKETGGNIVLFEETFPLGEDGMVSAAVCMNDGQYKVILLSDVPEKLVLHWGAALITRFEWVQPPEQLRPAGSVVYDENSVQTHFNFLEGINRLTLQFSERDAPLGIAFVLKTAETERWLKSGRKNIFVPVTYKAGEVLPELSGLLDEIIHGETGDHGWTLMHRFNLCHDLIGTVGDNPEGLAAIYVWMRYSAIRQLDWQRNFNTKPKELSHAQDRLSLKVSDLYKNQPESRELLRLIMSTLGRGGEGQRIRDEILHIMHRHHIKEVSGHFMEEWHQKLHNNTTPDDVVICEAYLEFLRSNGDRPLFYKTLEAGGVSRERMESFERPITTEPDFVPHLKDALLHDFGNYLKLLKSIHSGTDLESAINASRYLLNGGAGDLLSSIWERRDTGEEGLADYVKSITRARLILKDRLNIEQDGRRVRDMLFLDLALEGYLRIVIERGIHKHMDGDQLLELTGMVVENIRFSFDSDELSVCYMEWRHLLGMPRFTQDWALHAKAVLERLSRAAGAFVDRYYQMLQSKAEYLGTAFRADSWAVSLFSEEVVRGMPAFVLSLLLRYLEPVLRRHAKLGDWQVVSPGSTSGWIEVAASLSSVQGRHFERPSIIVADKVRGDEEPPQGATAILTPDSVDLVSHVAVRARNAKLLFATCYDTDCLERLKSLKGHFLDLNVNVSGDVEFIEAEDTSAGEQRHPDFTYEKKILPECSVFALSSRDFTRDLVGGKSANLMRLEGRLPEWIHLPGSAALPFGVFERVLGLDINSDISACYNDLLARIERNAAEILPELRSAVLSLNAPEELASALRRVMSDAGLGWPDNWDDAWTCIKKVWASKWNERAFLSRNTWRISHNDLYMAVLIQQVVDAEYAFVLHTANPFTGDRSELYAEVVPGLGETLVGNYPGRALSFISKKDNPDSVILAYPSKSMGMFGGGLIFRSDSNAEDLPGYAGAGLYDSIMLEPPREVILNYTKDRLTWEDDFKKEFMTGITKIGIAVEELFGSPQDIEGAYSRGKYYVVQTRPQVGLESRE